MAKHPNSSYLHLCEGAPALGGENGMAVVGKMLSYLVTDFVKGKN
jgi:formiminoglutamase